MTSHSNSDYAALLTYNEGTDTKWLKGKPMWRGALRASAIPFTICGSSLVFAFLIRLIPPYYFAALLGLWVLYAACRLVIVLARQSAIPLSNHEKRADLGYWLGAIVSSFLAALLWVAIVIILISTIMPLH